jgi:ethanolamine ammonia-lyase large subunit
MPYTATIDNRVYRFDDLKVLLAKVTPVRSGDVLAGIAAGDAKERVASSSCC